jgi:hypothetical protein
MFVSCFMEGCWLVSVEQAAQASTERGPFRVKG